MSTPFARTIGAPDDQLYAKPINNPSSFVGETCMQQMKLAACQSGGHAGHCQVSTLHIV